MAEEESGMVVLELVLSSTRSNTDVPTLCRLLCVSRGAERTVHASCAGAVALDIPPRVGTPLQRWLSRHAVLLRLLDTPQTDASDPSHNHAAKEAGEAMAVALNAVASLPGGLKLQSLSTSSVPVLNAAAAHSSSLTELHLRMHALSLKSGSESIPDTPQAATAFKGLSKQLRSLELRAHHSLFPSGWSRIVSQAGRDRVRAPGSFSSFLRETLPQLTALTSLVVGELCDSSVLQYAPAQIKNLEWVAVGDCLALGGTQRQIVGGGKLDLGHLTACTSLTAKPGGWGWTYLRSNDTLPPCLSELSLPDCGSVTPLLQLSQLTGLSITPHCCLNAPDLKRLSALTSLRKVALGHSTFGAARQQAANHASAGWAHVPVQELHLNGQLVEPGINGCLRKLTALTRLGWCDTFLHDEADGGPVMLLDTGLDEVTLYRLGPALSPSLRELHLSNFILAGAAGAPWRPGVFDALRALVAAARALPQLDSLCISNSLEGWPEAARELFEKVKTGEADDEEIGLYAQVYFGRGAPDSEGGCEGSEAVSEEVMAGDPVSDDGGGAYGDNDAVYDGNEADAGHSL